MYIDDLRVENLTYPLGIDSKTPRFSWKLSGEGEMQKSYRILVATEESLLISGKPDMWDGKEVLSDNSIGVEYGGKPLNSCTRYYFAVEVNGVKSETHWFETAFLNPEKEFEAYWIGQPLGFAGSVDDVRYDFNIDKPVKSARLYVAALGAGRFYLNGELLGDNYFDGAVSVYNKSIYYRTYELNFKKGKNVLCAKLGYGFYGAKKMYGVIRTVFEDGEVSLSPTFPGRAWNVKRDAIRLNGVYDGEVYDARLEEDWMSEDYKVTFGNWVATFAADMPKGSFKANPVPPMKIVKTFAPKAVERLNNLIKVDTGVNLSGFLTVAVKGERGAKITINHAERLLPDGNLDNANYRAAECTDVYILKGEGKEVYTPEFTYHGFQFAEIHLEGKVEVEDIKVNYLRTAVEESGKFECSDETLNALHKIAVQTEGNNLNGVFTDCPQRDERLGWLNDLSSRVYQSVCNYSLEKFLPNFVDMISESQYENGAIPDTVPFEVGSPYADVISAYTLLGKIAYNFYGDKKVIENNYENFKKWVGLLKSDADKNGGVVKFCLYGDWCPALIYAYSKERDTYSKFVAPAFMSGIYFLWYLKHMREFAMLLNKQQDAEVYEKDYNYYKSKFDAVYLDKKTKLYHSGSQTECAVATTVFEEDGLGEYWMNTAAKDVKEKGYHMTCGNQGYRHLIYNLAEYGYAETVYKLLVNPEYPGWGFMLSKGATSVWERWEDSVGSDMHSFNHPMFTAYDGFFYNYLLGIRTEKCKNGFGEIYISPCFIDKLSYAKGSMETVRGRIAVEWVRKDGRIELSVSTPANTRLSVFVKGKTLVCGGEKHNDKLELSNGNYKIEVLDKD